MSSTADLVSVIVPTYNRAHYLPACLSSILGQSHSHLEVIVVDDGSTDGTWQFMERLQREDGRVRYLFQDNGGVAAARNTGLKLARGEFIALLDSDDLWRPWKLEAQLAALKALPNAGMIWSDMSAIDDSGTVLHERYLRTMYGAYKKLGDEPLFLRSISLPVTRTAAGLVEQAPVGYGDIHSPMLFGNLVHTSTVVLRRERAQAVGFFEEQYRRGGEDYDYHLRTCRLGPVAFLDLPTTLYRIGCHDQLTHRRNQIEFARAFLRTISREISQHHLQIALPRKTLDGILSEAHCWLASELRVADLRSEALKHVLLALARRPESGEAWFELGRNLAPRRIRRWIGEAFALADGAPAAQADVVQSASQ